MLILFIIAWIYGFFLVSPLASDVSDCKSSFASNSLYAVFFGGGWKVLDLGFSSAISVHHWTKARVVSGVTKYRTALVPFVVMVNDNKCSHMGNPVF